MVTIKEKENGIWGFSKGRDLSTIYYEDGTSVDLSPELVYLDRGKYIGQGLDEISDEWYLKFLLKISTEDGDKFLEECVNMRLLELEQYITCLK